MNGRVGCLITVATAVVATGCGGAARTGTQTTKLAPTQTSRHALKSHAGAVHRKPLPAFIAGSFDGIKPVEIDFSADSGNIVTAIHWSSWTSAGALGKGNSLIQSCVPDCASGAVRHVRATIALSRPSGGHFTTMSEARPGQSMTVSYRSDRWALSAR